LHVFTGAATIHARFLSVTEFWSTRMWVLIIIGLLIGLGLYVAGRFLIGGFYTVGPDERAVITTYGRVNRLGDAPVDDPNLTDDEQARYVYPKVEVVQPGGPYFKMPWQRVHKVTVATQAVDLTWDPTKRQDEIESVTKDNLTIGIRGQLRYRVNENNLYAYFFGVQSPLEHVMGYFISVLRERVANFEDPEKTGEGETSDEAGDSAEGGEAESAAESEEGNAQAATQPSSENEEAAVEISEGVSINALRKNQPLVNQYMEQQCKCTAGRYGVELDAALVSEIDPPEEVDRALAAINSTRNQVAADISAAQADAEQQIKMSERAVEIAENKAEAEVAPIRELATSLTRVKEEGGRSALRTYLRHMRIPLMQRTRSLVAFQQTDSVDDAERDWS
jgi:regulator of protease activity HflC (stomatin/prohibitin superfamily)